MEFGAPVADLSAGVAVFLEFAVVVDGEPFLVGHSGAHGGVAEDGVGAFSVGDEGGGVG